MISKLPNACAMLTSAFCLLASPANSADLDGVWATEVRNCGKIFVKDQANVSFAKDSDIYGNGFIIEGNRIRAKTATCNVKSRKADGSITHLMAACATEIMLLDTRFSMRLVDHDTLERIYPGVPELDSRYGRCEM